MIKNITFSQWLAWRAQQKDMSDAVLYWYRAELAFVGSIDELIAQWLSGKDSERVAQQVEAARARRHGPLTFRQYVEERAADESADDRLRVFARLLVLDRRFVRGARKWQAVRNCLVNMNERRCVEYARELWEEYARGQGLAESARDVAQRKMKKRLERLAREA